MSTDVRSQFDVQSFKKVYLVGICGMGMTALALILKDKGTIVTGSDSGTDYPTAQTLKEAGITIQPSFDVSALHDIDLVIYSGANGGKGNAAVQAAMDKKIPVISLAEFVGELSKLKRTVSICGCHGKSTTSSLVSFVGDEVGLLMSYYVGAPSFSGKKPGTWGNGTLFAVESDEYVADPIADRTPKFLYLHPEVIICTNIDFDHPDIYPNIDAVEAAYEKFFSRLSTSGYLIINGDDERLLKVAKFSGKKIVTYGKKEQNDFVISNIKESGESIVFDLSTGEQKIGTFSTLLFGEHSAYNASGVIIFYLNQKITASKIQEALHKFTGVSRRIEFKGKAGNVLLYDDYAHHPTEIASSINAIKKRFSKKHVTVIFQPHTFSRTESLKHEFVDALHNSDSVLLLPIFASARETQTGKSITSADLVTLATKKNYSNFEFVQSDAELKKAIIRLTNEFSDHIFVTMGAGDVYKKLLVIQGVLA